MMKIVLLLLLLCHYLVYNNARNTRIIYGSIEQSLGGINIDSIIEDLPIRSTTDNEITPTVTYFNDTNKEPIVHWLGEDSDIIIYLARNEIFNSVFFSYDNGATFVDKTDQFKIENGSYAILEKFYYHPTNHTHIVFTDVINNKLYVTANYGRDIQKIELNFTPNYVSFHKSQPSVFVVLDQSGDLWITEDFGQSFRLVETAVDRVYWVEGNDREYSLIFQKSSDILYLNDLHSNESTVYDTDVEHLFINDDYVFMTKSIDDGALELQISYKLGKKIKCRFPGTLPQKNYDVVDVTNNRIVIVVSHSNTDAHLYVSEIIDRDKDELNFSLSLEDVLSYFPNSTWHETWLSNASKEAFVDVYKVEGLSGIYIATKVWTKPQNNSLSFSNLGSVITYDHGRNWYMLRRPDGSSTSLCFSSKPCTLHLGLRFSQLGLPNHSTQIISSKSAPGVILASGIVSNNLEASHYSGYISTDAGLTWRKILDNPYFYNIGDHGGILVATRSDIKTGKIFYSTNGGKNWKATELVEENLEIHTLMPKKGGKSTIFNVVGFLSKKKQWVFIKIDLKKALERRCTKDDYEPWLPNGGNEDGHRRYISCDMGEQKTYQRRKADVNCYNDENFNSFLSTMSCGCDYYDFECDFGFKRPKLYQHCIRDTNISDATSKAPSTCKVGESYNLTKGYRKIQGDVCRAGFENHYQPKELPCPMEDNQTFILIAAQQEIHKFDLHTQTFEDLPVRKLVYVVAVEYDMRRKCLYWADIHLKKLQRQCSNNSRAEILIPFGLGQVEGMALDWVSNNLYLVDSTNTRIELIKIDGAENVKMRRTIIGANILKNPRGIAVHPEAGYLFWTDWSLENPSISRSNLDGTNVRRLLTSPTVKWPNAITIDFIAERIYWTDGGLGYIASSDLHGDFQKLDSGVDSLHLPYGIAVFRNSIYWNDWTDQAVFTSDKDSFHKIKAIQKNFSVLFDLKVYGHGMQVGTNACERNNCSDICVGTPAKDKYVCLSPDERHDTTSVRNVSSKHDTKACGIYEFMCENGGCTLLRWACDGDDDCGDNSDEAHCRFLTCPNNYFTCDNGHCLPRYWRCDGESDCKDNSDEVGCNNKTCSDGLNCSLANDSCTHEQFACTSGECILTKLTCDGRNDCADGSDEANCTSKTCKSDEFMCGDYSCMPMTWRCDGEYDCSDHSDEVGCNNKTCPGGANCSLANCTQEQFGCTDGDCIATKLKCDGIIDCVDGSDEENCETFDSTTKPPEIINSTVSEGVSNTTEDE